MNCFLIFSGKSKTKNGKSVSPELKDRSRSDSPALASTPRSLLSPKSILELYKEREHSLRVFSFQELAEATERFNRQLKIGEGGFGTVYQGTINPAANNGQGDPTVVAIKKLNKHGLQGHKQWLTEVQFLGVVNHPNLVKLLGYCSVDDEKEYQRLLVYEHLPNKSLEDHLFNNALPTMPWMTRLEIIHGAAQGLAYLHEGMEIPVIHRDFKSSNVLLDNDFKAKLSDFGLAREGPTDGRTHVSTAVIGTYGYASPEYVETGHLTCRSDVWSFGVVLYEILTGKRSVDRNRPELEQKLVHWVKQFPPDTDRLSMIIDPRLRNQYCFTAARKIAKLAESCLNKNAKERPTMRRVVESLQDAMQVSKLWIASANGNSKSSGAELVRARSKHNCCIG